MSLAHQVLTPDGQPTPSRWLWFLHGFLGQGANWQSFARRLLQQRPDWGCLLIDLRLHGDSQALPPPHTMDAVASDLVELAGERKAQPEIVVGHSFGGRAALRFAGEAPGGLRQLWVLDAAPASRSRSQDSGTARVLSVLRSLPQLFDSRRAFSSSLQARGISAPTAMWLAKNLRREGDKLRLALQLDALQALLDDHDGCDCWPLVEAPPAGLRLHFVLAGRQSVVPSEDRQRLSSLADDGVIHVHELADAGHWLHTDDPEGLLVLIAEEM